MSHELRVAAEPASLEQLHELLAALWSANDDVDAAVRNRFDIAVAEIVANVVEHASAGTLVLRVDATAQAISATIEDDGPAFVELRPDGEPDPFAERGRGLSLARAAADELGYVRLADANRWTVAVSR